MALSQLNNIPHKQKTGPRVTSGDPWAYFANWLDDGVPVVDLLTVQGKVSDNVLHDLLHKYITPFSSIETLSPVSGHILQAL